MVPGGAKHLLIVLCNLYKTQTQQPGKAQRSTDLPKVTVGAGVTQSPQRLPGCQSQNCLNPKSSTLVAETGNLRPSQRVTVPVGKAQS